MSYRTSDLTQIGPILREARIIKGIEQKAVAQHLGHTPGLVNNVECGRSLPSIKVLQRWLDFLNIRVNVDL